MLVDSPALAADLREEWCQNRWPMLAPAAADLGVSAAFALPLAGPRDPPRRHGFLNHDHLVDVRFHPDPVATGLTRERTTDEDTEGE